MISKILALVLLGTGVNAEDVTANGRTANLLSTAVQHERCLVPIAERHPFHMDVAKNPWRAAVITAAGSSAAPASKTKLASAGCGSQLDFLTELAGYGEGIDAMGSLSRKNTVDEDLAALRSSLMLKTRSREYLDFVVAWQ